MRDRSLAVAAVVVGVAVLCAWCGWVTAFHRTTYAAEATWLCSLGAVLAIGVALRRLGRLPAAPHLEPADHPWPRPGRGGGRRALWGTGPWLVLSLAALSWDVLGLDTGPNQYHLTLSALTQAYRPLNAGVLLCWILVGIGYQVAHVRSPRRSKMAWEDMTTGREPEQPGGRLGVAGIAGAGGSGRGFTPGMLLPQHPVVGVVFWVAVPVAAVVVDQLARRSDGRLATAEELVRFVSTRPAVNVVCVTAWVFAGYHLFAR